MTPSTVGMDELFVRVAWPNARPASTRAEKATESILFMSVLLSSMHITVGFPDQRV
jgi:hypothetical protein